MSDSTASRTCPKCGKGDIEPHGGGSAFFRRPTGSKPGTPDKKVTELVYRCRACGECFSEMTESEWR